MKKLLARLREEIELDSNTIQFELNGGFYELNKDNKGNWTYFSVFGDPLKLNTENLRNKPRPDVEAFLKTYYPSINIY